MRKYLWSNNVETMFVKKKMQLSKNPFQSIFTNTEEAIENKMKDSDSVFMLII